MRVVFISSQPTITWLKRVRLRKGSISAAPNPHHLNARSRVTKPGRHCLSEADPENYTSSRTGACEEQNPALGEVSHSEYQPTLTFIHVILGVRCRKFSNACTAHKSANQWQDRSCALWLVTRK